MLIWFDFVGHLCWKGQFYRFDSLASVLGLLVKVGGSLLDIQSSQIWFAHVNSYKEKFDYPKHYKLGQINAIFRKNKIKYFIQKPQCAISK
jgi:hypothetical protein